MAFGKVSTHSRSLRRNAISSATMSSTSERCVSRYRMAAPATAKRCKKALRPSSSVHLK